MECIMAVHYSNQFKCAISCGQTTFSNLGSEKFVPEDGRWLLHAKVWIRFSLQGITYIFSKEFEKEAQKFIDEDSPFLTFCQRV